MSTNRRIKKIWCLYVYSATRVDLKIIILSKVTQTDKDQYHMISFTYEL